MYYSADHKLLDGNLLDGQAEVYGSDDDHIQFVQVQIAHSLRYSQVEKKQQMIRAIYSTPKYIVYYSEGSSRLMVKGNGKSIFYGKGILTVVRFTSTSCNKINFKSKYTVLKKK